MRTVAGAVAYVAGAELSIARAGAAHRFELAGRSAAVAADGIAVVALLTRLEREIATDVVIDGDAYVIDVGNGDRPSGRQRDAEPGRVDVGGGPRRSPQVCRRSVRDVGVYRHGPGC